MSMTFRRAAGFSLIEVLVAVLVLSIGLLGVAMVLVNVDKTNASSYQRQAAQGYAHDILERMRANQDQALAGAYDVAAGTAAPASAPTACTSSACSASALASADTQQWLYELAHGLSDGSGSVATKSVNGQTRVTVTVSWNDKPAMQMFGEAQPGSVSYTLETVL